MKTIYFDPAHPAAFAGPDKLYRVVKQEGRFDISKYKIRKWLKSQEPYSLHQPAKRRFRRNRVWVSGIDDQWDMDLMDVSNVAEHNDNIHFVLVALDIFSKYLWLRPLVNKTGPVVAAAVRDLLSKGRKPNRVRTDKGQEFRAKPIQAVFKDKDVHHFETQNEVKANFAERVIRTLRNRMHRYMTHNQTFRYLDHLQDFANSYNSTHHRTIGMMPRQVSEDNETKVWWRTYWDTHRKSVKKERKHKSRLQKPFRFKIGDNVRITYLRNVFTRDHHQKWSGEVFKIARRILRGGLPIYYLKDYHDQDLIGSFYQPELQRIDVDENQMWKVEKILKSRTRRGKKEHFVRWLHWPKSFDQWVKAEDITNL